jgi:hypothetical protein
LGRIIESSELPVAFTQSCEFFISVEVTSMPRSKPVTPVGSAGVMGL